MEEYSIKTSIGYIRRGVVFSGQTNTYAAAVGTKLIAPEAGWMRYDDSHSAFTYLGANWIYDSGVANLYNLNHHYSAKGKGGNEVSFKFYGTKLRLISSTGSDFANDISVNIDGISEQFNPKMGTTIAERQILTYEKTNLPVGIHEVKLISGTNGEWRLDIDAIDIDATGYLINPNLSAPLELYAAAAVDKINLNWTAVTNATAYKVKRSITSGGPYETIASNVTNATYADTNVTSNVKYYYVVTAVNVVGESIGSKEATAIIVPETGRAILTIYLNNGTEKEYDLSMTEVNAFIDWYDQKDAGVGMAKYAFIKTWNKGPFAKRTEYVVFDKILTFNVDEYASEE